jgi:hypothetical protein
MRIFYGLLALMFVVAACDPPPPAGPAERAGQALDRAGERVRDAVDPPGPVERAGRAVDRATR